MQLSQESYRARWFTLVGTWIFAALLLFATAGTVKNYLTMAGELGLRGKTPSTPLQQVYTAFSADAQTWVRHSLALTEGHSLQLRETTIDNAPQGREVHWNSAWAWTIAGGGYIYHLFTGTPYALAVEKATIWLNPCVFLVLIAVLSAWATKRAGAIAGILLVTAMVGNDRIYEGFFPGYVDHHGLLTIGVFGLMLGAIFMGGGWYQQNDTQGRMMLPSSPEATRKAAIFSALSGACGLWVSAASTIPPIALVGLSGLIVLILQGHRAKAAGATFDAAAWRTWGRVGAVASVIFYLLEYFPTHLGFRLEANHPFHALAWWGGGELIAQIGERWLGPKTARFSRLGSLALPLVAVCITPAVIAIAGTKVFVVIDPFMSRLHNDYIQEFLPIWKTVRGFDAKTAFQVLAIDNLPLFVGIATLTYFRRETPIVVWFATFAALFFNVMAWGQVRWLLNASGVQMCLTLVLLACWTRQRKPLTRWIAALVLVGALYLPSGIMRYVGSSRDVAGRRVTPGDANGALQRDIAAALRATQPTGEIVVLASPNASTGVGYYGRFKTLGTLYWENVNGLKAAASIFSATSMDEAAKLIKEHRVTHIAILSSENFIQQYFQLLNPKASTEDFKRSFGYQLYFNRSVPQWLEAIPYTVPDDLKSLNNSVTLYKVNFNQSLADAVYHVVEVQIANGEIEAAENSLDFLIKNSPQSFQPHMLRGSIQIARHQWDKALESLLTAAALAPAQMRSQLYLTAGSTLYTAGQHALAVTAYRKGLEFERTSEVACYLAWVLASSRDDGVRNGPEAVTLAQEALRANPNNPTYLSAYSAALAETGRMSEAVEVADRALANSRLRNEPAATQQVFLNRLELLRSGKPLRN